MDKKELHAHLELAISGQKDAWLGWRKIVSYFLQINSPKENKEILNAHKKYALDYLELQSKTKKQNWSTIALLGHFYERGWGIAEDKYKAATLFYKAKAFNLYSEAAIEQNSFAYNFLGNWFHDKKNYKEAAKWYALASVFPDALENLGDLYEKGLGVRKDLKIAERLYKLANQKTIPAGYPSTMVGEITIANVNIYGGKVKTYSSHTTTLFFKLKTPANNPKLPPEENAHSPNRNNKNQPK